jgi:predicted transposase/invertase (TIGR01784 family)
VHEVYALEEVTKMAYISNAEKFGIEKGILEGKREGKREGRLEGKLEVARHLLAEGIKPNIIERSTGFSPAEIKKLQQEVKQTAKNTAAID